MIAPFYGSYDSVYRHTDYFAEIVKDAFARYPMIDKGRVYVTEFSNGGAAAVALTDQYPEQDRDVLSFDGKQWIVSNYYKDDIDIPFGQLILVEDGIHWARPQHAGLAWDFLKHFRRNEDDTIEVLK